VISGGGYAPTSAIRRCRKRRSEVLVAIVVEPVDEGEADFSAVHLGDGDRAGRKQLL
jgi:hypothetical protein